jgi:riboflavin kinase/FMN adenylyltransferase
VNDLAVVITFHPHPATVVRNRKEPYYLTTPEDRAQLLGDLGVDIVLTLPFDQKIAQTTAHDFMAKIHEALAPSHLFVGRDFALGREREGNVAKLQELGDVFNYRLVLVEPIKNDDETVSSSSIRKAITAGDVHRAQKLLGRAYRVSGKVVPGDGRGKQLGIPTANLEIWPEQLLPKAGVYACLAIFNTLRYKAATNIGVRPTFENQGVSPNIEAHLLEFNKDIYGKRIHLDFIARLRDEKRFSNLESLVSQIHQDIASVDAILAHLPVEQE